MFRNLIAFLFLSLICWGCAEEIQFSGVKTDQQYYPVKVGSYWIYDVSETKVSNNVADSSVKYQVRNLITDTFTNLENELTYQVIQSRRVNASEAWGKDTVVLINKYQNNVRVTKNNKKVIALIFPVKEGKTWNSNAFNSSEEQEFMFEKVNASFKLNNIVYDSTLTVRQAEADDIKLEDSYEVYAPRTGLIYKKQQLYEYYNVSGRFDRNIIVRGLKRIYKLNSFQSGN
ncbi:hypothetical protein [Adhaeribacter aquaticus]|uniref:hypothetical protein n=1 Tax=Adhaeribacter aquaticus TaxID=299567 RepID=UPI0004168D9B|nr:hypothetical protein [Adhaeribacter aquaticus]